MYNVFPPQGSFVTCIALGQLQVDCEFRDVMFEIRIRIKMMYNNIIEAKLN